MDPERTEIIEEIARTVGVEPEDLDFVLYEYVDIDAIRMLADHDGGTWELSFEVPGASVTITSEDEITVVAEPRAPATGEAVG